MNQLPAILMKNAFYNCIPVVKGVFLSKQIAAGCKRRSLINTLLINISVFSGAEIQSV